MARKFDKLTRTKIRRLKSGERITEHGIHAECLKDGDIRYTVNVMVDGERIHRVIGRESEGTTRTQAEDFIEKARSDAREERLNLPKGRKLSLTFAAAADLYLEIMREGDGKNVVEKEKHLRLYLVPELGKMQVDRIKDFTLRKFRRYILEERELSYSTFAAAHATYRHLSRILYGEGKIRALLPTLEVGEPDNRRDYVLSPNDKDALLEAAMASSNTRVWLFIMIGLHTALRHSEILGARFDNLDIERRRLRVQVKGGGWRDQPLTQTITKLLERECEMADEDEEWIFPNTRSKSGHVESMKKAFREAVDSAKLNPKKVTPHTLRHTAITGLAESGADFQTLKEFSGHKTDKMVMRYLHARVAHVNKALDAFDTGSNVEQTDEQHRQRS